MFRFFARACPTALCLLVMVACGADGWWSTQDTGGGGDQTIRWAGSILDGPYTGENGVLTGGEVVVEDLEGDRISEGTEPSADEPGYWELEVPPEQEVALHLAAEDFLPAVWRSRTPASRAWWYTGALFAYRAETWGEFFQQFDGEGGVSIRSLDEGICWLWGAPLVPEEWVGAALEVQGGDGASATVLAYRVDEEGYLERVTGGQVDYFLAFNLEPGEIRVRADVDGRSVEVVYPAEPGEVVSAWFLALPEEDS